MEERLKSALEFANYRQTLNVQLSRIRVRSEGMLMIAKGGGSFTIDRGLICFLDYLVREDYTEATLLDDHNAPVYISDVPEFLREITTRYFEVTNDYLKEYSEIRKARSVKTIADIKDA